MHEQHMPKPNVAIPLSAPLIRLIQLDGHSCYINPALVTSVTRAGRSGEVVVSFGGDSVTVDGPLDKVACAIIRLPYNEPRRD